MSLSASRTRAILRELPGSVWRILLHSLIFGLALSVADLLFNFYLVSLGYAADTAGLLSTVARAAGMLLGLPTGLLIDRIGARSALLLGLSVYALGWALLLLFARELWALIVMQFVIGAAYLLTGNAVTPLLTTVTSEEQRTTVFGWNATAALIIGLLGSAVGGVLPSLTAPFVGGDPQSTAAYTLALSSVVALSVLAMLPLFGPLRARGGVGAAVTEDEQHPTLSLRTLARFAAASFLLGIGGGAILPFQNLFFRQQFGLSDAAVGVVLAWSALGMGLGGLLSGPASTVLGLRRGAALLRLGALPAMLLMLVPSLLPTVVGFFLRGLCVAGSFPMNDALVMRNTPQRQRGVAISMMGVLWSGGWALAALISGWAQLRYGFTPVILVAALAYALSALAITQVPNRSIARA
jgi:MFS family permease